MALTVRVPNAVSSITLATSGVLTPVNGIITVTTAAEQTALCYPYSTPIIVTSNPSNGQCTLRFPSVVTSITVNSNVYSVTNGVSAAMSAVDVTAVLTGCNFLTPFDLVTGV